jgi:hypothetical protein
MSPTPPPSGPPVDPLRAMNDPWLDWWRQVGAWSYGHLAMAAVFPDLRQVRTAWLADLSRSVDACLRSPVFLDWMRSNLAAPRRSNEPSSPSSSSNLPRTV